MTTRDLYAKEGESIRTVLSRTVRYLRQEGRVSVTGPARIIRRISGTEVVYDPDPVTFPGSFPVRVTGALTVEIGEGLVSGLVPTIAGRRIDGLDEEGEEDPEGIPELTLEAPESGRRTWIVMAAQVDDEGQVREESAGAVEILHLTELPPRMMDEDGRPLRIVAAVAWKGGRVERVRQVVWYDQEVYRVDGVARYRAAA